jgi:carbon-monoxide dehydrogenase medium subunit
LTKLFRPSNYYRPLSIKETSILLIEKPASRIIAGGTEILVSKPPDIKTLIDITNLPLSFIKVDKDKIRIGSLTIINDIEAFDYFKQNPYNILSETAHLMGTPINKNIATIGGNVCHGVPSADMPVSLMALDSEALILGLDGEKKIPLDEFYLGVRHTILKQGELLGEIHVPTFPSNFRTSFKKLGRMGYDIALVNSAVCIALKSDNTFYYVRIILGAVAPVILRSKKAEDFLIGKKAQDRIIEEAAQIASEEVKPISDIRCTAEYRRIMSAVLVKQALKEAIYKTHLK